jgi:predicted nucleic acid-binding protein
LTGPFVLDASVTLSWCFQEEDSLYSRGVLATLKTSHAVVPALWPFEIANVLALAERRGRITNDLRRSFLTEINQLSIQIENRPALELWEGILELTEKYRLTGYDAAYLELAQRTGLPLATLDGDLRKAALTERVALVETA